MTIYPRRACITCSTKFTPTHEQEVECGECHVWQRELDDWGAPEEQETDDARAQRTPADVARSQDNYRRGAGRGRRS